MKQYTATAGRRAHIGRQKPEARAAQDQESAGPLARVMLAYIVVVVGRVADVVPHLSGLPIAKIVAAIALLISAHYRSEMASNRIWSFAPARLTVFMMMLITATLPFSVLRSGTLGVITGTVLSVCVGLVLMIKAAKNWRSTRAMLFALVLSGVLLSAAANITSFAGRAGSISSLDPNDFAFVLDGLLPIALTFALASRGIKKLCYLAGSLWIVLSILLTQSRGGFLGLVIGIPVMLLIAPTKHGGLLTRQPSAKTIITRALLVFLVGFFVWHLVPQSARARLETLTVVDSDRGMTADSDGRFTIWEDTLPLSLRRPWGWGAGAFPTVDGMFAGGRYKAPHNTLLQALIELGFVGLILAITTVITSMRYLAREAWAQESTEDSDALERRAFARAMIASLFALCVSAFFLSELYSQVLWTVITLSCVVGRPPERSLIRGKTITEDPSRIEASQCR